MSKSKKSPDQMPAKPRRKLKRTVVLVATALVLMLGVVGALYIHDRGKTTPREPQVVDAPEQPKQSDAEEYEPELDQEVNVVIRDKDLGYELQATRIVVEPFADKSSITNSDKEVILVKYVIRASTKDITSPVGGDLVLIDANGSEVSPSTLLVEGRMKDEGYTPGPSSIGVGEIRTGYEAYFVTKTASEPLKIQYTRSATTDLAKKVFSVTLRPKA